MKKLEKLNVVNAERTDKYIIYTLKQEYPEKADQSEQAETVRRRLKKNATADPDLAGYWTLPGEVPDKKIPETSAG